MNAIVRYLDSYRHYELGEASLPDWYIRRVLGNPPADERAVIEAAYSAQLLEEDRRHV